MLQKRKRGLRLKGEGYSFDAPIRLEKLHAGMIITVMLGGLINFVMFQTNAIQKSKIL